MSKHEVASEKQGEQSAFSGQGLSTNRVEALADGIFAVAMTLLVLDVHPPAVQQPPGDWFFSQWPRLFAYALSFMLLGVYWVSHHAHFQYIKRTNRTLLWINIVFFLFISLIPFSTSWLADSINLEYIKPTSAGTTALICYGLHLIVIAALIALHWWYGSTNPLLTGGKASDRHFNLSVYRRIAISPVICLVAIGFSFILPIVSLICYTLIPIVYIFPGHVDLHWTRANHH
jgi:uncharacterized membrane protein